MTTATAEKTLPQLCDELGITLKLKKAKTPRNASDWQKISNSWLAILEMDGYVMATPYYTGKAVKKTTVADVVHSLASDWNIFKQCEDLNGYGDEFGWDAETVNTWNLISHNAHAWEHFIGNTWTLQTLAETEY